MAKTKSTTTKVKRTVVGAAKAVGKAAKKNVIKPVKKALGLTGGKKTAAKKTAAKKTAGKK